MRISVAWRISVPPAIAGPSTAAMSGLSSRKPLSSGLMTPSAMSAIVVSSPSSPAAKASPGASSVIASRSAPAQKAPPAPVSTTARMSGFALASSQAAAIPSIISIDNAFLRSGRFIVTTRTCPSRSVSRCSTVPPSGMRGSRTHSRFPHNRAAAPPSQARTRSRRPPRDPRR